MAQAPLRQEGANRSSTQRGAKETSSPAVSPRTGTSGAPSPPGTAAKPVAPVTGQAPAAPPSTPQSPAPAVGAAATETRLAFAFPDYKGKAPESLWPAYFEKTKPPLDAVRLLVSKLHNAKEYEHVISVIQSAILNGQAQPWMYEILAMEMEVAKRPKEEIERVALSISDFGQADFASMMYSGAYLANFGRTDSALRMYRQASRMLPERPEPYIMALPIAQKSKGGAEVEWVAAGLLEHVWIQDFAAMHRSAEDLAAERSRKLRSEGNGAAGEAIEKVVAEAKERDVRIVVRWSGNADLDLTVEEPGGGVCSIQQRFSTGGGFFVRDGFGPEAKNCVEEYICPRGLSGTYRVLLKTANGQAAGNRAEVEIVTREGTAEAKTLSKFLPLTEGGASYSFKLEGGRRDRLRQVDPATSSLPSPPRSARLARKGPGTPQRQAAVVQATAEFFQSRQIPIGGGTNVVAAGGVVAYQPVIQIIPEGSQLFARAQVSPDRRYVRIAVMPVFSTITNVFNFTFLGGAGTPQPAQPAQTR